MNSEYLTAEHNVIGSILISAEACFPIAQSILKPDDFTVEINSAVYAEMLRMNRDGISIDPVTILARLGGTFSGIREYLMGCMEVTVTATNIEAYAQAVKNESMLRKIQEIALSVYEQAKDTEDYTDVIGQAADEFAKLQESGTNNALVSSEEAMTEFTEYRSQFDAHPEKMFVRTGFENLDDLLGSGLVNSGLYIIAARPGVGKTTLALNIADNMAEHGLPVLFISLEMSTQQITAKRIASRTGLSYELLMLKQMDERDYDKMAEASAKMARFPLTVNRKPGASVRQIESMARSIKGIRCLVIDYLGLIRADKRAKSRYEEITEISGNLKSLALKLGIPILCLAQLNRETEREKDSRPKMYHLRDSGAIEQDADGIMLLHRAQRDVEEPAWQGDECECILTKNRHGDTGITKFSFFGAQSKLVPIRDDKRRFE